MLFRSAWQGDVRAIWRDTQLHAYLGVFAGFSVAIGAWLVLAEGRELSFALRHAPFTVASVMTTTGFASTDWALWGPFPLVLVFMLTFVGGCSGSTAGGIKIFRFQVLAEVGRAQMRQALLPSGVFVAKYNRKPITDAVAQSVLAFVTLYGFTWAVTAAALGLYEISRRREQGDAVSSVHMFAVLRSPAIGEVVGLGALLFACFIAWLYTAQALYIALFSDIPPHSTSEFLHQIFGTPEGWTLIVLGNFIGFLYAAAVLVLTVASFPMIIDRHVGIGTAVRTSVQIGRAHV